MCCRSKSEKEGEMKALKRGRSGGKRKRKRKKKENRKRRRRWRGYKNRGYKNRGWWKVCKDFTNKFFKREEDDRQGKGGRKDDGKRGGKRKRRGLSQERVGRWFFFVLMIGHRLVGVTAASEKAQNREGQLEGTQGGTEAMDISWVQMNQRSDKKRRKAENGRHKESNMIKCALLTGFAWSTENKYKGTFDVFLGVDHRMRKEEMERGSSSKEPNKVGDLHPMQQGSPARMQKQ